PTAGGSWRRLPAARRARPPDRWRRRDAAPPPPTAARRPRSQREAAIGEECRAGGIARLIGGQIDGDGRHFFDRAEPAHGLAFDEHATRLVLPAHLSPQRLDALVERRRLDGTGADGVAADALADEVDRHGLGEAHHGGFGGPVDVAV